MARDDKKYAADLREYLDGLDLNINEHEIKIADLNKSLLDLKRLRADVLNELVNVSVGEYLKK